MKQLRLRYGGTCVACGAALPKGAQAMHDAASKTVRCVTCPEGAAAMPAPPIDPGTAGASAQKEHDRRVDKRKIRVTEKYGPRLGGFIVRVTDEPQLTRAWAKGARRGRRRLTRGAGRRLWPQSALRRADAQSVFDQAYVERHVAQCLAVHIEGKHAAAGRL